MSLAVRQSLIDTTLNHFAQVRDTHKGQLLFWAGSTGSGRGATLQALAHQLADDKAVLVVRGSFRDGDPPLPPLRQSIIELYGTDIFLTAASTLHPLAGIVAQLIAAVKPTRDMVSAWKQAGAPTLEDDPLVFRQVLIAACKKQAVVCLLSDYEDASVQWGTFWSTFTTEMTTLPLMVVLTLEAPTPLPDPTPADPDSWKVAYYLCGTGRAQCYAVPSITREDLAAWMGLADEAVIEQLWRITKGNPRWTEFLWEAWQTDGVVESVGTGWFGRGPKVWQFTVDYTDKPFHPLDHVLGQRFEGLGLAREEQLALRQVLSVGALQGRSFAAPAVVAAIEHDHRERQFHPYWFKHDTVIIMLDKVVAGDRLIWKEIASPLHPQELRRYFFTSDLVWLTLRRYGLELKEQPRMSLYLAQQLEVIYQINPHPVADSLARLFKEGGNKQKAEHYRQVAEIPQSNYALLIHCQILAQEVARLLKIPQWSRFEEQFGYRINSQLLGQIPHLFGKLNPLQIQSYLESARNLAQRQSDKISIGLTLYYLGKCASESGELKQAMSNYRQALVLLRGANSKKGEASVLLEIGKLWARLKVANEASLSLDQALSLFRSLGERKSEAHTLLALGSVFSDLGGIPQALMCLDIALNLFCALGDKQGEGNTLFNFGVVYSSVENQELALDFYQRALILFRIVGDQQSEARTLTRIGKVWAKSDENTRSLESYRQSFLIQQRLNDLYGAAETLIGISQILEVEQNLVEAIAVLNKAVNLLQQTHHPQLDAQRQHLATLEQRQDAKHK